MIRFPSLLPLTLGVLLLAPVPGAFATPGAGQDKTDAPRLSRNWKRIQIGDLTAAGPVSDSALRHAVDEVAAFRAAFATLYPTLRLTSPLPLRIVVLPNRLQRFTRDSRGRSQPLIGGYFDQGPEVSSIVLGSESSEVALHELAHFLLMRNFHSLPGWLNEGLAEFHSTFQADWKKGLSVIGRPPVERMFSLRRSTWVPLREIVLATDAEMDSKWRSPQAIGMYYAESWAVVHYLMIGRTANGPDAFARFVQSVEQGTGAPAALEATFGLNVDQLDREVRNYLRRYGFTVIGFKLPKAQGTEAAVERMTEVDARYLQADLLLRPGSYAEAEKDLKAALALDPDHVPSRIGLARVWIAGGRRAEGIAALKEIAGPPASAGFGAAYYLASALSDDGRCEEALDYYDRAITINKQSTDAWFGLSVCTLALGRVAQSNAAMSAVMQLQATPDWYRVRAYAALGLGNADAIAASDARRFIKTSGWEERSVSMAVIAAIAHWRLHQPDQAREILEEARAAAADVPWTTAVIDYLEGRLSAEAFLSSASSNGEKTEAHTYVGFKAVLEGDRDAALSHFRWAVDQGDPDYLEVDVARRELNRLQPH